MPTVGYEVLVLLSLKTLVNLKDLITVLKENWKCYWSTLKSIRTRLISCFVDSIEVLFFQPKTRFSNNQKTWFVLSFEIIFHISRSQWTDWYWSKFIIKIERIHSDGHECYELFLNILISTIYSYANEYQRYIEAGFNAFQFLVLKITDLYSSTCQCYIRDFIIGCPRFRTM